MDENMVQMDLFGGERLSKPGHQDNLARHQIPPMLDVAPEPAMVRVAPGRHAWVPKDAATPPDEYVMCRWSKQPDGTYARPETPGRFISQAALRDYFAGRTVAKPEAAIANAPETTRVTRESPLLPVVVQTPVKKSLWRRFLDWLKSN